MHRGYFFIPNTERLRTYSIGGREGGGVAGWGAGWCQKIIKDYMGGGRESTSSKKIADLWMTPKLYYLQKTEIF